MTGDTHLPDVESDDLSVQEGPTGVGVEGTPCGRRRPSDGRPGRGINKAGVLKEKDSDQGIVPLSDLKPELTA